MRRRLMICVLAALVFAGALGWHTLILREVPEGRVEVLVSDLPAAEDALAGAGRVLVRASGTEALIRVMVEAKTTEIAKKTADSLVSLIKSLKF